MKFTELLSNYLHWRDILASYVGKDVDPTVVRTAQLNMESWANQLNVVFDGQDAAVLQLHRGISSLQKQVYERHAA